MIAARTRTKIFPQLTAQLSCLFQKNENYCKIPKISPGAYIFQRPFLRGLFLEGLIFGGAYLRSEICVSKSIGLALQLEVNLPLLLWFTLYLRASFQVQAPGELIFCVTGLGGLYLEGLYMEELMFGIFRVCRSKARFHAMQLHPAPPPRAHAAKSVARALF